MGYSSDKNSLDRIVSLSLFLSSLDFQCKLFEITEL